MWGKKPTNVMNEEWNVLIILDACRYDIFRDNYSDFLEGKLEKRISVGVNTPTWLKNTFKDYYEDIIYISGNPYVNSKHVDFSGVGFDASKHFYKIIDVWDFGFDKFLKTVHPVAINKSFFKYNTLYPDKRFILHYLQPHYPYISVSPEYIKTETNMFMKPHRYDEGMMGKLNKVLPHSIRWKMMGLLKKTGIKIDLGVGQIYLDKGWKGVKEAYTGDLRFVLKYVSKLVRNIDNGKIIVTADHGERLGERGRFGHGGSRDRKVIEVPWLEITK